MRYDYGEFDGQPFTTPDMLFPPPQVVKFILQHGEDALDALDRIDDEDAQQYIEAMIEAGLLERDEETGRLRMTPRMVRGIEHRAFLDIFEDLNRGTREGHPTTAAGRSDERGDGTKPYEFGDPISEVDLAATMRNALRRQVADQADAGPPNLPLHINANDFELHITEGQSDVALCILLDMSGSMMRYGRFYQAKRVALGMAGLMRKRFPQDTIDFVGFYSLAERIPEAQLPLAMPKPVTIFDYQVRVRMPLEQAMQKPRGLPQHFTNLQLGLRVAERILSRRGAANKQVFIITDGQPTAHVEPIAAPGGGEMLYLLYPPDERTTMVTLKEALRCQQRGIRIATFALVEDYWGMDWVGFIDKLTRLTRGTAFYCSSEDLSSTVIESYLNGKRRKSYIK
jgi:Ca-activated chloride channel homolog